MKKVRQLEDRVAAGSMLHLFGMPTSLWSDLALPFAWASDYSSMGPALEREMPTAASETLAFAPERHADASGLELLSRHDQQPENGAAPANVNSPYLDPRTADQVFAQQAEAPEDLFGGGFLNGFQAPAGSPLPGAVADLGLLDNNPAMSAGAGALPGGIVSPFTNPDAGAPLASFAPASNPGFFAGPALTANGHAAHASATPTSSFSDPVLASLLARFRAHPSFDFTQAMAAARTRGVISGGAKFGTTTGGSGTVTTGYLGSLLLENLYSNYTTLIYQPQKFAAWWAQQQLVFQFDRYNNKDRVLINVRVLPTASLSTTQQTLQTNLGMTVTLVTPSQMLVTGYLPIVNINSLSTTVSGFAGATPVYLPQHWAGIVTTQGDHIILADAFRAQTGLDGKGVTVGVLSDSVNQRDLDNNPDVGIAESQRTGDLPASGVKVLKDGVPTDTDEGRGMLEIIHDVAPGASLAFNTSDGGPDAMAQGIINLANQAHAQVIVDDTSYPDEPTFSQGLITQAINQVTHNNNVIYVTAAGNEGNKGWSDVWRPVTNPGGPGGGTFENFSSGSGTVDALQDFSLQVGQTLNMVLTWNAPYLEGGTDQFQYQVHNELDVEIRDPRTMAILGRFADDTRNTDEAIQRVLFTNDGSYGSITNFALDIRLAQGPAPQELKWVRFDNNTPMEYQGASTIWGHAAAGNALTVGAVPASNPTQAELYSAQGGAGLKPDLVAPDQVYTATYPGYHGETLPPGTFPVFAGTSAAAAHVAALAALRREQMPKALPGAIARDLELNAKHLASKAFDPKTGLGLAQIPADPAILPPPVPQELRTKVLQVGPNVAISHQNQNIVEEAIAIDPQAPQFLFADANPVDTLAAGLPGLFVATSHDFGASWSDHIIADGTDAFPESAGDPSTTWDSFGNLFVSYVNFSLEAVDILLSTDEGQTFTTIDQIAAPDPGAPVDQPTIVSGAGSVWITFNNNVLYAGGAAVDGLGAVGQFHLEAVPFSLNGNFGDIAIGPSGQVMVAFQNSASGVGPDVIKVSVDPDGLGPQTFGTPIAVTPTNVGAFDPIVPQPNRTIDAEAGLAWDRSNGPRRGRVYLVYTDAPAVFPAPGSSNTNIFLRQSDDNGFTWSAPIEVNDLSVNAHFLPRIALDETNGDVAISWLDARFDGGNGPPFDTDGIPNTDVLEFATVSLDGGKFFSPNIQIAEGVSNAATLVPDAGFDFGDYTGLAFDADSFYPVWPDNSTTLPGNDSPLFTLTTARVIVPLHTDKFDPNETSDKPTSLGTLNLPSVNAPPKSSGFNGLNFNDSGFVPPDTDAAAGPTDIVETVNDTLAIYSKTGTKLLEQTLGTFFGRPNADLFDPVVSYDDVANRFIVAVLDVDFVAGTSSIDVAISDSSDPTSGFTEKHIISTLEVNAGGKPLANDYQKVGWNGDAIVFTVNMFTFSSAGFGTFDHVQVITLDANSVLDKNNATLTVYRVDRPVKVDFTMAAASMHGQAPFGGLGGPMWFVEEDPANIGSEIDVVEMTNPLSSTPTFTVTPIPVAPYLPPPVAPEKGGNFMQTDDSRILNAEWRNGILVASQNVGLTTDADAHARWYEFSAGVVPSLIDMGTIAPGAGISTYYPAISILNGGTLGISYMESSVNEFVSMYIAGRLATDPLGVMERGVLAQAGDAGYEGFDGSPFRAGDYSGISPDPSGTSFWAANEFATSAIPFTGSNANWATFIQNFKVNQPLNGPITIGPLSVNNILDGSINGLPDYDWYKWTAGGAGTLNVVLNSIGDIELHLFTVNANNTLVELDKDLGLNGTNRLGVSATVTAGEPILVEVKGQNTIFGYHEEGVYDMTATLT